jgi:hypothetical protein
MLHPIILVGTALNHPTFDVGLTSIVVKHDPLTMRKSAFFPGKSWINEHLHSEISHFGIP